MNRKLHFLTCFFIFNKNTLKPLKKVNNKFYNEFFIKINHKKLYSFGLTGIQKNK